MLDSVNSIKFVKLIFSIGITFVIFAFAGRGGRVAELIVMTICEEAPNKQPSLSLTWLIRLGGEASMP